LKPGDAAQAVALLERAEQETGRALDTIIGLCNAYLTGLARADDMELLDKALGYLDTLRAHLPPEQQQCVPSAAARHDLIRSCGRCARWISLTLATQQGHHHPWQAPPAPSSPSSASSGAGKDAAAAAGKQPATPPDVVAYTLPPSSVSRAAMAKYCDVAEGLFEEYSALVPEPQGRLLSDMVRLGCARSAWSRVAARADGRMGMG